MTVSQRQLYNLIFTHDIHRCVFPTRLPAGIIERGKRECTKPLWQNVRECILEFTSSCPVVFYSCVGCFPKDQHLLTGTGRLDSHMVLFGHITCLLLLKSPVALSFPLASSCSPIKLINLFLLNWFSCSFRHFDFVDTCTKCHLRSQ